MRWPLVMWIVTLMVVVLLFCVCVALVFATRIELRPVFATATP